MRILIAEDDVTSRTVLALVLKRNGYEVMETRNGREAWQALQQPDAPQLVILDWMMPEMDGPTMLRQARTLQTDCPPYIIMLTAKCDKPDVIRGLDAGANDYVPKPFDPEELLARVEVGRRVVEMQLRLHCQRANAQRFRVETGQRMSELQDALTTTGEELHRSQTELHVLTARLQALREEERANISRELHAAFEQHFTALQDDLTSMDRHLQASKPDPALLRQTIMAMMPRVEHLIRQIQTTQTSLRPGVLSELGLVRAIQWQAEDTAKHTGMTFMLSLPAEDDPWDQNLALALFRIVQEALTNVVRHARATHVEIRLDHADSKLELVVHDNGRGFPPALLVGSKTLGLLGMRERIGAFGGTVEFLNEPGTGATVRVRCSSQDPEPTEPT
ncbi:MAG: response regulator [Verrucomicrobia bacterium]|nr:response regulator [Verrucomicrobiota bacterium]